eukprot:6487985-Amphidinium_carterae.7
MSTSPLYTAHRGRTTVMRAVLCQLSPPFHRLTLAVHRHPHCSLKQLKITLQKQLKNHENLNPQRKTEAHILHLFISLHAWVWGLNLPTRFGAHTFRVRCDNNYTMQHINYTTLTTQLVGQDALLDSYSRESDRWRTSCRSCTDSSRTSNNGSLYYFIVDFGEIDLALHAQLLPRHYIPVHLIAVCIVYRTSPSKHM